MILREFIFRLHFQLVATMIEKGNNKAASRILGDRTTYVVRLRVHKDGTWDPIVGNDNE